jgi:hypothetical protein
MSRSGRTNIQKYRDDIRRLDKLIEDDAPAIIKAHALVNLLIPRLVVVLDCVEEFTHELGRKLAEGMCTQSGVCRWCKKAEAAMSNEYCDPCSQKLDAFCQHIMDGAPEPEGDDEEAKTS